MYFTTGIMQTTMPWISMLKIAFDFKNTQKGARGNQKFHNIARANKYYTQLHHKRLQQFPKTSICFDKSTADQSGTNSQQTQKQFNYIVIYLGKRINAPLKSSLTKFFFHFNIYLFNISCKELTKE